MIILVRLIAISLKDKRGIQFLKWVRMSVPFDISKGWNTLGDKSQEQIAATRDWQQQMSSSEQGSSDENFVLATNQKYNCRNELMWLITWLHIQRDLLQRFVALCVLTLTLYLHKLSQLDLRNKLIRAPQWSLFTFIGLASKFHLQWKADMELFMVVSENSSR